jgi:hypothetical protein
MLYFFSGEAKYKSSISHAVVKVKEMSPHYVNRVLRLGSGALLQLRPLPPLRALMLRSGIVMAIAILTTASTIGRARAVEVYPGCAVPAAPKHIFYVDPVHGSAAGDGSLQHPWNSLSAVVSSVNGASPLLSSVPYWHRGPTGSWLNSTNPNAPVKPGDAIELMSGNYGDVWIGVWGSSMANSDFVTIEAAPSQTPVLSRLTVNGANKWYFKGLKVQALASGYMPLVEIKGQSQAIPNQDIVLDGLSVSSQDDVSAWSQADWRTKGRWEGIDISGIQQTSCTSVSNTTIHNVRNGANLAANQSLFANNVINNFGDDALDYAASNLIITHNTITNSNTIGDENHNDAMQGQIGQVFSGVASNKYNNILIDSNLVIRQTDHKLKFPGWLQGIDAFDEDWSNVTVSNNVVTTSACWGIFYASLHGGLIINNTVLSDDLVTMPGNCKPAVAVGDKSHEGSSSYNVTLRNNIANAIIFYNIGVNMVMDHNVCSVDGGNCIISYAVNGAAAYFTKPGTYGDSNIIDSQGSSGEFVNFNPSQLAYGVQLKAGAQARGAGSSRSAPALDITGATRTLPMDIGGYAYKKN